MEKVRAWCGQPSDRGRLKNRTERSCSGACWYWTGTCTEVSRALQQSVFEYIGLEPEGDLGMFSMFGRTGAHTKGQHFFHFLQHTNKPEILK